MARSLATAAINELRNAHYVRNPVSGLYEPSVLLEGSSTNLVLQSEDFGTTWTTSGTTTRTAAAIPASVMGVALDLLGDADGAAAAFWAQTITFTGDGTKAFSIFLKKGANPPTGGSQLLLRDATAAATRLQAGVTWDASGVPTITMVTGTLQETPREIANGVYRAQLIVPGVIAANVNQVRVIPCQTVAETGDVYAGGVQAENNAFCTSYVKNTTATVTRSADSCSFPFTLPPQEMTFYAKFVERGTIQTTNGRILHLGTVNSTAALLVYRASGSGYAALHNNGSASVTSQALTVPNIGDLVEVRTVLGPDGKVTCYVSTNGGAEVAGATSAANALGTAWNNTTLSVGSQAGATSGFSAFLAFTVARGTKSLAEMRALAGV